MPQITQLHYMLGAESATPHDNCTPWIAGNGITIYEAPFEQQIAGSHGYLTTYIVEKDGSMIAKVPGWAVEVRYAKDKFASSADKS